MEQRRNAIVELVNREGSLSFVQLKEAFPSVSEMTLRTDLKALDQARRVVRVHGGVKSVEVVVGTDDQFGRRTARNASEKQIIAEKAAALLRPNTTVFLDSGSTATAVARCVPDEPMLIFTSGLTCAIELARLEKPKVSIPGGTLNRFSHSVCGVRGIQELEGVHFDLIEPLDHFFKDEVRALGTALGLPDYIVHRQGPGLAIRIIGDVDAEKLSILKNADAIVREELDAYNERLFAETGERNSEHAVWQYFAVLPDIKSVGVMGDERTYARPMILRAVESSDAMTADWARLPYDVLARISGRIVAEVPGVNRVVYDITSKPPATIEWE